MLYTHCVIPPSLAYARLHNNAKTVVLFVSPISYLTVPPPNSRGLNLANVPVLTALPVPLACLTAAIRCKSLDVLNSRRLNLGLVIRLWRQTHLGRSRGPHTGDVAQWNACSVHHKQSPESEPD